jgi:hypothetical protein
MLREHRQRQLSLKQLREGLAGANLPGEPVAHIKLAPAEVAARYDLSFQDSFDNLDDLKIALVEFPDSRRIALVHHNGFPRDETELYADQQDWKHHDIVPDVLGRLGIPESNLSWRQTWPISLLSD